MTYSDFDDFNKEYEDTFGSVPKRIHAELKRNYCYSWCKAWGKSIQDWIDYGFDQHKYSQAIHKDEAKQFKLFMEKHQ